MELDKIICGDCLEIMKEIPDKSIDLVLADPPYFNIMKEDWTRKKYEWDAQWETLDHYLAWINDLGKEIKRVLKPNGSFYIFADDKNSAYVQTTLDKSFHLENSITWVKPNNMTIKGWTGYRSYAPITERILFYSNETEKTGLQEIYESPDCFRTIKEYMRGEREKIIEHNGFKTQEKFNQYINKVTNTASVVSRHYFPDSQWVFPTKEIYALLQTTGFFGREYEDLRREYEDLRREYEDLRRPFCQKTNFTDVWRFSITGGAERVNHPTQKPLSLISRIVETSTRENGVILDPFMGSGTSAVAAKRAGRHFIGIELSPEYCEIARKRVAAVPRRLDSFFPRQPEEDARP